MKTMTWDGTEAGAQRIRDAYAHGMPNGFLLCYIASSDHTDPHWADAGKLIVGSPLIDGEIAVASGGKVPVP